MRGPPRALQQSEAAYQTGQGGPPCPRPPMFSFGGPVAYRITGLSFSRHVLVRAEAPKALLLGFGIKEAI